MIKLEIKLFNSQIDLFSEFLNECFKRCREQLTHEDYYNSLYILKTFMDKRYSMLHRKKKLHTLKFDLNMCATINKLYDLNVLYIKQPEHGFYYVIFQDAIAQIDKQKQSLFTVP